MKKAFTFAEILIVLMIIGILIALCMTAATESLRNAYNLYYYRTFNTLMIAFEDFLYRQKHIETYNPTTGEPKSVSNIASAFKQHLDDLVNDDFRINEDDITSFSCGSINGDLYYDYCDVTIPTIKTKANNNESVTYRVIFHTGFYRSGSQATKPTHFEPMMILIGNVKDGGNYSLLYNPTNVVDNVGILPAYIDNGTIGRYITGQTYKGVFPRTYREAFCSAYNPYDANSVLTHDDDTFFKIGHYCGATGIKINDPDYVGGVLRLIPPKGLR